MRKTNFSLSSFKKEFYSHFFCKKHLLRDFFILLTTILFSGLIIASNYYSLSLKKKTPSFKNSTRSLSNSIPKEIILPEIKTLQETIDTTNWSEYQNRWYGFALKYPTGWQAPLVQKKSAGDRWIARYQFIYPNSPTESPFDGFNLTIYENSTNLTLFQTAEFSALKAISKENAVLCQNIQGHLLETGDYPAEEIYIGEENECYFPTLFFSINQGQYIYNLSPKLKTATNYNPEIDRRIELTNFFPEFFSVAANLRLIDIVRPKPIPPKPKITAPRPVSFEKDALGRLVCDKKNDKPSKSDKTKKKHLDMECCLDPDEYPNPHCYYDPKKYGKYL